MARLLHHMSLVATAIIPLLLLLDALDPAAATAAEDTPAKKVGMRFRIPSKEEEQWLDRYAETHQPLGAGPLRMVRATPEEEHWLNHHYRDVATTDDGGGSSGSGYIDFDDDNPYVDALRDWVKHLIKQSLEVWRKEVRWRIRSRISRDAPEAMDAIDQHQPSHL